MSQPLFKALVLLIGLGFALAFGALCIPPLPQNPDVMGAFAAGFVNPHSSGYALDAICCWALLTVWVVHEARHEGVRHGWIAVLLGIAPGVATGFAVYLLMRLHQAGRQRLRHNSEAADS